MTRDQELERQLAEWLQAGPVVAPPPVVERAIVRSRGRQQRHRLWRWLAWLPLLPGHRARSLPRMAVLTAVLSAVLLTSLWVTLPLGGPGRAPEMKPSAVRAVSGVVHVADDTDARAGRSRTFEFEVGDPRIDGRASVALGVSFETTDMYHYRGTMRLENDWGAWEGPVEIAGYPTGEEVELARLAGEGAFEGFTYVYAIHGQVAGAERTVEGAIWPDEPPSMPDPSSLP